MRSSSHKSSLENFTQNFRPAVRHILPATSGISAQHVQAPFVICPTQITRIIKHEKQDLDLSSSFSGRSDCSPEKRARQRWSSNEDTKLTALVKNAGNDEVKISTFEGKKFFNKKKFRKFFIFLCFL